VITSCFPDIKVKEQTIENMMKNRPIFEPPRFMSNQQAAEQLIQVVKSKDNASSNSVAVLKFDFS
jgi:diphthine synthase